MKTKRVKKLKVGDRVKSHFRARWQGVVIDIIGHTKISQLLLVCVDTDRNGKPMRKPLKKIINSSWLTKLE